MSIPISICRPGASPAIRIRTRVPAGAVSSERASASITPSMVRSTVVDLISRYGPSMETSMSGRASSESIALHEPTRELLHGGTRIRLQEQPFLILKALLARPGELVTRDALRDQLWPEGTFVDF